MYRQIVHFLQGQVLVRIECGCPERVLNLCGARGIPFWELTWESPVCLTLRFFAVFIITPGCTPCNPAKLQV